MNGASGRRVRIEKRACKSQDEQDDCGDAQSEQQRLADAARAQLEAGRLAQELQRWEIQSPRTPPGQQVNRHRQRDREKTNERERSEKKHESTISEEQAKVKSTKRRASDY